MKRRKTHDVRPVGTVFFQLKFTSSSHSVDEHGQDDSDSDWAEDYDEDEVLEGFDYAAYWAIFQVGCKGIDVWFWCVGVPQRSCVDSVTGPEP